MSHDNGSLNKEILMVALKTKNDGVAEKMTCIEKNKFVVGQTKSEGESI
jgi:hypothetical protein